MKPASQLSICLPFLTYVAAQVQAEDKPEAISATTALITQQLQGSQSEEVHFGRFKFLLPAEGQSLGRIFTLMEANKRDLGVLAYGVAMPTLEQVFLTVVGESLQQ